MKYNIINIQYNIINIFFYFNIISDKAIKIISFISSLWLLQKSPLTLIKTDVIKP